MRGWNEDERSWRESMKVGGGGWVKDKMTEEERRHEED